MTARDFICVGECQVHPGETGRARVYVSIGGKPQYFFKVDSGDLVPARNPILRQIKKEMGAPPKLRLLSPGEEADFHGVRQPASDDSWEF